MWGEPALCHFMSVFCTKMGLVCDIISPNWALRKTHPKFRGPRMTPLAYECWHALVNTTV